MKIAREGIPSILFFAVLAGLLFRFTHWGLGLVGLFVTFFFVYFFRNPRRQIPQDPLAILSPADGKVLAVEEVEESRFLHEKRRKISIFMSPLDVHINRIPISGLVREVIYYPGKYLMAFHEKSSLENEQNAVIVTGERVTVLFVQIAGFLARRIVCHLKKGDPVEKGSIYGMIRLGSRMDVYLPLSCSVIVKAGDRVKGGESWLARIA